MITFYGFQTTEICFALSTSDNRQRIINIAIVILVTSLKISLIYPQQPTSMLANVKNRITMHDLRETIYLNKLYTQFNLTNNTLSLRTSVYLFVASGVLQFSISHHSHIFD